MNKAYTVQASTYNSPTEQRVQVVL